MSNSFTAGTQQPRPEEAYEPNRQKNDQHNNTLSTVVPDYGYNGNDCSQSNISRKRDSADFKRKRSVQSAGLPGGSTIQTPSYSD